MSSSARLRTAPLLALLALTPLAARQEGAAVPIASREQVSIEAGNALRTRPTASAPVVTVVEESTVGELVEQRGGWKRVRIGATTGWMAPAGSAASRALVPGGDGGDVDRVRLSAALARLPEPSIETEVVGVSLRAPEGEAGRLDRWATVTRHALESWPGRLGIEPVELAGATVVFAPGDGDAEPAANAPASAGGGVALIALGEREDEEIEALLVHELSHLASEVAFPRALPIWLEEGIAEWLAREPLASDGYAMPGTLRGEITVESEEGVTRTDYTGPLADLAGLIEGARGGRLPALERWTALPDRDFQRAEARSTNYALAGTFVRFLFEADTERAERLRAALATISDGDVDPATEIDRALGDSAALDAAFRSWLADELERQLLPVLPE